MYRDKSVKSEVPKDGREGKIVSEYSGDEE